LAHLATDENLTIIHVQFVFSSVSGRAHVLFTFFAHSGVQHILCCVFVLFFFVLCTLLPISLDCLFLIAPSIFSNVYLYTKHFSMKTKLLTRSLAGCRTVQIIWTNTDYQDWIIIEFTDNQETKHKEMQKKHSDLKWTERLFPTFQFLWK
jgi:hypothetical protein